MTEFSRRSFVHNSALALTGTGVGLSAASSAGASEGGTAGVPPPPPYLNIRDFGAKGDGRADDTKVFQDAMAKAEKEAGVVYFPPGHYRTHPVKVPSNITLLGHSAWAIAGKPPSGYRGRTRLTPISARARAFLDLEGQSGTRIQGLSLDGQGQGPRMHGIYVSQLGVENGVVIEDCRIESFSGSGVRLDNAWVTAVRRCFIAGCNEHGIDLSGSYDIWIIDNEIGSKGAAIYAISDTYAGELPEPRFAAAQKMEPNVDPRRAEWTKRKCWGVAATTITACRLEWSKLGGVVLYDSESVQINGCSLDQNFGPGIMLTDCRAMTVTGCLLRANGRDRADDMSCHLRIEKSHGVSATGNSLFGYFGRGKTPFTETTPFYGMVLRKLDASVITANAMYQSGSKQGILDHGEHTESVIASNMHTAPT